MLRKFFKWFSRRCLSCREAAHLISQSYERPLTFSEKMRLHLLTLMCPYTARYQKQIGLLHSRIAACELDISEKVESSCLSEQCKQRLREELAKDPS